jgi:hypothetical protein
MRKELKKINDYRGTFYGEFVRKGYKKGWRGTLPTILLKNIRDENGKLMCDHLWFNYTKGFEALGELEEGAIIQFDARVRPYIKGYKGYRDDVWDCPIEKDYKLSHPTKIFLR